MAFQDHFSERAKGYSRFRPSYPDSLFRFLASRVPHHELAWDCATGSGQAAAGLSPFFRWVIATDASQKQIAHARQMDRVFYCISLAEETPLKSSSVDVVTVSQALHWLKPESFFLEVRRVLKRSGLFAVWFYSRAKVQPDIDEILERYYTEIVGPHWPPQRKLLEDGYRTVVFPFEEEAVPDFRMEWEWDLEELKGYLRTWSATQRYTQHHGRDPVLLIDEELNAAWGEPTTKRKVRWPLTLRMGRP